MLTAINFQQHSTESCNLSHQLAKASVCCEKQPLPWQLRPICAMQVLTSGWGIFGSTVTLTVKEPAVTMTLDQIRKMPRCEFVALWKVKHLCSYRCLVLPWS